MYVHALLFSERGVSDVVNKEAAFSLRYIPTQRLKPENGGGTFFEQNISHRIHEIGISTSIWLISMVNVGKYTIHGWYGF